MQDTLAYLVSASVNRDANKFLYILNQIDVTAQEITLKKLCLAAFAEVGLVTGRFYRFITQYRSPMPILKSERFEKNV